MWHSVVFSEVLPYFLHIFLDLNFHACNTVFLRHWKNLEGISYLDAKNCITSSAITEVQAIEGAKRIYRGYTKPKTIF
tara:strand:+ start:90 stop:323 length:234 start_codon:yes stop_codon:yes gene_type:complete